MPQVPAYLMAVLSSSIWSRSCWASSCKAARSCCSMVMYSAVFCSVVALLTCGHHQCGSGAGATPAWDPLKEVGRGNWVSGGS